MSTTRPDARTRDTNGRFAPAVHAESSVSLQTDAAGQVASLDPAQVEPLLLEYDADDTMAADVISALRRHPHAPGAKTWQQSLNDLTGARPGTPGLVEVPVRERCFNCAGRGMDERSGGECMDCGGTGTILADRILRLRHAPDYSNG